MPAEAGANGYVYSPVQSNCGETTQRWLIVFSIQTTKLFPIWGDSPVSRQANVKSTSSAIGPSKLG